MTRRAGVLLSVLALLAAINGGARAEPTTPQTTAVSASTEWPTYGHDPGGMRFSPLTQITPANVSQLEVAWVYHMRPAPETVAADAGRGRGRGGPAPAVGAGRAAGAAGGAAGGRGRGRGGTGFSHSQNTGIVIDGVMYIATPYSRVVALDATTGKEMWVYQLASGQPSTRGVEYWPGDAQTPAQIVFGTSNGKLHSVNAKTGVANPRFGANGIVELNTPEILQGPAGNNALTSPPSMYRNLIITGGRTQENPPLGVAGDVRAWDIHTGRLVWTFRSVPPAGHPHNATWGPDSWQNRSGVNVWGPITVDVPRGIVYMPFGAPSVDQYGGDRPGDNLYSSSLVAAEAATGKYLWHFQLVRHDIWDADVANAPVLFDITRNGQTIPAVGVIGKSGLLFILDRVSGKPIYDVEDRPVPQSEVPLERTAATQPFPVKPAPLSRLTMSEADIVTLTPELEAACRELSKGLQMGGPYLPVAYNRLRVQFPGNHGGQNWGGMAFNPQLGYMFVNTSEMGQMSGLKDREPGATGPAQASGQGNRVHPDAPYESVPGGGRYSIREEGQYQQLMCQQPPWGNLTAIDVSTGEFAWRVTLGVTDHLPPDKQKTGRPGNGGPIATAGGLVFVAATDDARFRAFDARTGEEKWVVKLGGTAHAVPSTYQGRDGRQYVVITSTGGGFFNAPTTDDSVIAYALPR